MSIPWTRRLISRGGFAVALTLVALLATACGSSSPALTPISNPGLSAPAASSDWLMFGGDPARTGVNPGDSAMTAATAGKLTKLWQVRLPATADSTPILLHGLAFPGGPRDVLYLTTLDGRLLALDASNGKLLWQRQPSGPKITNSSPVASANHRYVYSYGLDGFVHRYDPVAGHELNGDGFPAQVTRMTQTEKEGSALNLANNRLYVTTGGYIGDAPPYQGHVVTVDLATGHATIFNSLCSNTPRLLIAGDCQSQMSGIWSRGGAVADPVDGSVWVDTGNGPFDANQGGPDYGDSILHLSPDGATVLDSFTPRDYQQLQDTDTDLGSSAPALFPRVAGSQTPLMAAQAGKDGLLRLFNREDLSGQGGPGHLGGGLQTIDLGCGVYTQSAVWTNPTNGDIWLYVASACGLKTFRLTTNAQGVSRLAPAWGMSDSVTSPVIAGAALFAAQSGALTAYDPLTGKTLWSSAQSSAGGSIGDIHWESPIVVGTSVYVTDQNQTLTCYGVKP